MKYVIEIEIPYPEDLDDLAAEIDMALCSAAGHCMPGDSSLDGVEVLSVTPLPAHKQFLVIGPEIGEDSD